MGWEVAILEALGKWHSSPGSVWVVGMPGWVGWWSQVPPGNGAASPRRQLSLGLACTESSLRVGVWFRSYCCFCCWDNSNHWEFPCSETLPCTAAQGPRAALLTLVCTITGQSAGDHQPLGIVPKGESAPSWGCPVHREAMKKQGRVGGLSTACAVKSCKCKCLVKHFSRGWNKG